MKDTRRNDKEPIRGWMVVLAIFVWIAPFVDLYDLVGATVVRLSVGLPISYFQLFDYLIQIVFAVLLLTLLHQRKKVFVSFYLVFLVYTIIALSASLILKQHPFWYAVSGYLEVIVVGLYLIRSNRVKRTFVR